jgi:NAD(P)-dependent dehydrogenase (short-subunit alcohol dehydrogenase family)
VAKSALVIGGSGGIAHALIQCLSDDPSYHKVVVVSRQPAVDNKLTKSQVAIESLQIDSENEAAVESQIKTWAKVGQKFTTIISTVGILHNDVLKPEKRLEDLSTDKLLRYFQVNTLVNAVWLKFAPQILDKNASEFVVFSARVGSISDNGLGGWYGYRASKAALNMLMKTASAEYKRRMPNTRLVCYHPGTVDTGLSKPFQANVKPDKLFTPEFTAQQLLSFLPVLSNEPNIHYIDWQGKTIPW